MWSPFSEEHDQFRKTVRRFAEEEVAPNAAEWEAQRDFPNELFKKAGDLGILGAQYKEEHGGAGGDFWFSVCKAEELPYGSSAGITLSLMVQSDMATPVISDIGTPEQIDEFLKPALAGEKIAAIAVTEPGAGSDVAAIKTFAREDGDDFVINGQKTFITNGTRAHFLTMLAKTDATTGSHGCSFFLVPTDLPGFRVGRKIDKIGNHASDTAELFFEDVRIPKRNMLGTKDMGFMYLMQNFQSERLAGAVAAVAGCGLAIDVSRKYGEERQCFGKPVIKREVWQHKFVDMITRVEVAKAFVYKVADAYNSERYEKGGDVSMETVKLVSMAKIIAGDLATDVMDTCLQFHGGWGYTDEYLISRAWRDSRLVRIGGGTNETLKYYLAKLIGL